MWTADVLLLLLTFVTIPSEPSSMSVIRLPIYPSSRARKSLSPSQLATLQQLISTSLEQCLLLPMAKCDTTSTIAFLSSYAQDTASHVLQDLIWSSSPQNLSQIERTIRHRVLMLAERTAAFLDFQVLLDLAVAHGKKNPKAIRNLFAAAWSQNSSILTAQLTGEVISAFTTLLNSAAQGLYGIRKISYMVLSSLQDRKSTRLNSSHSGESRMPSSA